MLIVESQVPVTLSPNGCTVISGRWMDPWSDRVETSPADLDIDHTVPLGNAWRSGAWAWAPAERIAYANDLVDAEHLIAIPDDENQSKSDDGPEGWRPPAQASWCNYARTWVAIKARWKLTATEAEWSALVEMTRLC
ncbi:MAG: GmrSD restriction endonuclease domain-containing protein [Acidimicrobiales bacterium]